MLLDAAIYRKVRAILCNKQGKVHLKRAEIMMLAKNSARAMLISRVH
jgi:hypothetical protein